MENQNARDEQRRHNYRTLMGTFILLGTAIETFLLLFMWPDTTNPLGIPPYFAAVSAANFGIMRWCSREPQDALLTSRAWMLALLCSLTGWLRTPATRIGTVMFSARAFIFLLAAVAAWTRFDKHERYLRGGARAHQAVD